MKTTARTFSAAVLAAVCVPLAQAHPGHEGHELTWGFRTGFAHPFTGLDHFVAMIAVGWWAVQLGGRARWLVPAAFLAVLAASAAVGHWALRPTGIEQGVAASVLALGLLVASAARFPALGAAALAGTFAAFHGLAHGAEAPLSGLAGYGAGFIAASAVLLGLGQLIGLIASRAHGSVARLAGIACAAVGIALMLH